MISGGMWRKEKNYEERIKTIYHRDRRPNPFLKGSSVVPRRYTGDIDSSGGGQAQFFSSRGLRVGTVIIDSLGSHIGALVAYFEVIGVRLRREGWDDAYRLFLLALVCDLCIALFMYFCFS